VNLGVKRLTTNDVSWFHPQSKSHQSGVNLPLKSFKDMFAELILRRNEERPPREQFVVAWYSEEGELICDSECDVVYYPSKNELRLLHIPKQKVAQFIEDGVHLLIRRDVDAHLTVTCLPSSAEHLLSELGMITLLDKLPSRS
jgi:hypothetical protein